jgi:hypothetical protein
MSNSLSRLVTLILFLVLAVPTAVLAQAPGTADISGVVLDASGQPVAGYPMKFVSPEAGLVVMHGTENDGTFGVEGLPPGDYEFRVYQPGGSPDAPIAFKKITLAADKKETLEIRLGSEGAAGSKLAAGDPAAGSTLGAVGVNWTAVVIVGVVLAAALGVFLVMRSQRAPGA